MQEENIISENITSPENPTLPSVLTLIRHAKSEVNQTSKEMNNDLSCLSLRLRKKLVMKC